MIGSNELFVVLLLALVFLGPERLAEAFRVFKGEENETLSKIKSEVEGGDAEEQQDFTYHLEELRKRIIISIISIIPTTIIAIPFTSKIIEFFKHPYEGKLIFIAPTEAFVVNIKVAILTGIILASPIILFQIWKFVAPGLYPKEKKIFGGLFIISLILFLSGISFAYFIILPLAFKFLMQFASDWFQPMLTAGKYFSFIFKLMIAFGFVFQLPIIIVFLTVSGVISIDSLKRYRRHVWVASFIIGAILTPPDVLSQVLMSVPLILLFELSLIFALLFTKRQKPESKTEQEEN